MKFHTSMPISILYVQLCKILYYNIYMYENIIWWYPGHAQFISVKFWAIWRTIEIIVLIIYCNCILLLNRRLDNGLELNSEQI